MCFIQRRSSSTCSHFSASFLSSRKMLGSDGSVEARMRIRSGHQFSISRSARALTPQDKILDGLEGAPMAQE